MGLCVEKLKPAKGRDNGRNTNGTATGHGTDDWGIEMDEGM